MEAYVGSGNHTWRGLCVRVSLGFVGLSRQLRAVSLGNRVLNGTSRKPRKLARVDRANATGDARFWQTADERWFDERSGPSPFPWSPFPRAPAAISGRGCDARCVLYGYAPCDGHRVDDVGERVTSPWTRASSASFQNHRPRKRTPDSGGS